MKYIIYLLLGLSLFGKAEEINEQEVAKRIILKMNAPALEAAKKGLVCLELKTEQGYLRCKQEARQVFLKSEFGQIFKNRAKEITSEDWIDKKKRETSIHKLKKTIKELEPQIVCAKNPKTVDFVGCME